MNQPLKLLQVKRSVASNAAASNAADSNSVASSAVASNSGAGDSAASTSGNSATGNGLGIELSWNDGRTDFLPSPLLREHCPCATCQEKRGESSHSAPLKPQVKKSSALRVVSSTIDEAYDLKEIRPVGNYAINLLWGDKHDSGIFSYVLLRTLAEKQN